MNVKEIITRGYLSCLGFVVDDDVGVVRHDHVISEGRLVHGVLPPLVLEDAVDHGVVGTRGGQGGVRHQGAVHAVPVKGSLKTNLEEDLARKHLTIRHLPMMTESSEDTSKSVQVAMRTARLKVI